MTSMNSVTPIYLPRKFATAKVPGQDAVQESPATGQYPSALSSMTVSEEPVALGSHTATPDNTNKQDIQTSAASNLAALPQCTNPQLVEGSTNTSDENLLQASPNCQTPHREPKIPREEYTHSPYPSPEVVSFVLPPELPLYSPSSRSSFRRLSSLPARPTQAARADRNVPNNQALNLRVHIEMGYLGAGGDVQHDPGIFVRANRTLNIRLLIWAGHLVVAASLVIVIATLSGDVCHLVLFY